MALPLLALTARTGRDFGLRPTVLVGRDPLFGDRGQVGSLAGAAYLLDHNAGVLREAQCEQESHVAHKGKKPL